MNLSGFCGIVCLFFFLVTLNQEFPAAASLQVVCYVLLVLDHKRWKCATRILGSLYLNVVPIHLAWAGVSIIRLNLLLLIAIVFSPCILKTWFCSMIFSDYLMVYLSSWRLVVTALWSYFRLLDNWSVSTRYIYILKIFFHFPHGNVVRIFIDVVLSFFLHSLLSICRLYFDIWFMSFSCWFLSQCVEL